MKINHWIPFAIVYPMYVKYDRMMADWVELVGIADKYTIAIREENNIEYFREIRRAERSLRYCFTRV